MTELDYAKSIVDFRCNKCDGRGYITFYKRPISKSEDSAALLEFIIIDCAACDGVGLIKTVVIDQRVKSRSKELFYDKVY